MKHSGWRSGKLHVVATTRPTHPYLDWPGPIAFAHRGGALDAPENTMAAFQCAVDLGYAYLETDAQVTKDGVVLAYHDDELERCCNRPGVIGAMPYAEVRNARVHGSEPIPLLEEVLTAWPGIRVNIDCKTEAAVEPLATLLQGLGCLDRVCLGSFDRGRMRRLRSLLGPDACTGMTRAEVASFKFARRPGGGLAAQVPTDYSRVPVLTQRFVDAAHRRGIAVHAWTIDEASEMHRLLDLGVDGIITDRPRTLKQVLEDRGEWFGRPIA